MAFRCQNCNQPQPAGTKPEVLRTFREKTYNIKGGGISVGSEIASERRVCSDCAAESEELN